MSSNSRTIFRYMPAANITVGKPYMITGRGNGIVRGILTRSNVYLTKEATVHISEICRVCLYFDDGRLGASLVPFGPTESLLVPGWGTYIPTGSKDMPWRELR
jgi:hypothetical protein